MRPASRPRLTATRIEVGDDVVRRLRDACATVTTDAATLAECQPRLVAAGDDVGARRPSGRTGVGGGRPADADEVSAVVRVAADARVPVTAAAGRSGVCGASVPVYGGIVLDLTGLSGIVDVDDTSLVLDVRAGTFGTPLEDELRAAYGKTLGHWPQSIDLSTVGGWLACRSAGQYSNRYGKIEDMVVGLDVVLADGTPHHDRRRAATSGRSRSQPGLRRAPRARSASSPARGCASILRPSTKHRARGRSRAFTDGLELLRRVIRRGATPAVLRLYDATEADRTLQDGFDPPRARPRRGRSRDRRSGDAGARGRGEGARRPTDGRRRSSTSGWSIATTSPRSRR